LYLEGSDGLYIFIRGGAFLDLFVDEELWEFCRGKEFWERGGRIEEEDADIVVVLEGTFCNVGAELLRVAIDGRDGGGGAIWCCG